MIKAFGSPLFWRFFELMVRVLESTSDRESEEECMLHGKGQRCLEFATHLVFVSWLGAK
jgi:hypothetical protein